ncbi:MAG TPA: NUDIX domain-containing protein [Ensifer sp.]|nr:NUDIX domain-containing protein [Ensifer sp.]
MGIPGIDFPGLGVGLVIRRGRSILLYRRTKMPEAGHWNIPGGKVDHLEACEDALRRETLEETGLKVGEMTFLCVYEYRSAEDGHHWVSLIYLTDDFTGEPRVMEPEKLPEFGWFDIDALPEKVSKFTLHAVEHL